MTNPVRYEVYIQPDQKANFRLHEDVEPSIRWQTDRKVFLLVTAAVRLVLDQIEQGTDR